MMTLPLHPRFGSGQSPPELRTTRVPGPETHTWMLRARRVKAPMGPRPRTDSPQGTVFSEGYGCNVWDPDGNRYVDLAAGFGSLLLGHCHPHLTRAIGLQSERLLQAMGDLYDSDAKIGLLQRLSELSPIPNAQMILGLSGADAVTAALKTALLATGRPGVIAFSGAYHGLSYAPLAACGLREGYRSPFSVQLNPAVRFLSFPDGDEPLTGLERELERGEIGAVLLEPILGRGGVRPLDRARLERIAELTTRHGALWIADEIWTGLGRCGAWFWTEACGVTPDLLCLGKGLGGGTPISACIGSSSLMQCWSREPEVVHTQTFAGAALSCTAALATLDGLERGRLVERASELGARWKARLVERLSPHGVEVRGRGLMLGLDFGAHPQTASTVGERLLQRGYLVSTGGGDRDVLVLTPPLIVDEALLEEFDAVLLEVLAAGEHG